mmetsp:Transcript_31131/g.61708  ORF Transcript_31131/g.61708 Transcript_31131/m.61708 type:complete len:236 (-) Transcript_31131:373-1080(-)|eukprot:CAMPEP_0182487128 /NCGR_PEP_ID=MMETSP1319-20130603/47745_1 /TAXON_ID=172717 /ORGANISM="Bolidomonas pacifica, Strain RCC208" /LENGTH=235 /DNA_ID=CAMNT_0024689237 /DNA_START=117 /DNA_END=824 /DNA_ORIENTATION=-
MEAYERMCEFVQFTRSGNWNVPFQDVRYHVEKIARESSLPKNLKAFQRMYPDLAALMHLSDLRDWVLKAQAAAEEQSLTDGHGDDGFASNGIITQEALIQTSASSSPASPPSLLPSIPSSSSSLSSLMDVCYSPSSPLPSCSSSSSSSLPSYPSSCLPTSQPTKDPSTPLTELGPPPKTTTTTSASRHSPHTPTNPPPRRRRRRSHGPSEKRKGRVEKEVEDHCAEFQRSRGGGP